jgi:hypothetical protein
MSQSDSLHQIVEKPPIRQKRAEWDLADCDKVHHGFAYPVFASGSIKPHATHAFAPDWANLVPSLISKLASDVAEKKKLELRFNLFEIQINNLQIRLHKLESAQTKIVPINTFAPEPYELLKPILVAVQSVEDEFEAGWFDANIHTEGANEEEAVKNLKSLILDYFDSFSGEPIEKLGPEPSRQLSVLSQFIQKKSEKIRPG